MKYPEYKGLNLPEIDNEIRAFWNDHHIFEKSVSERQGKEPYIFYEGPPSANGKPGIHHVMARAIKDIFCRFQTMSDKLVERKGGWDTHGLPVELKVEKELGITKEDIGTKISIADYNQKCRETVMQFKDMWDDLTRKMGYWVDLENPYVTFENDYIESLWFLLKKFYDKGLLYKGYTIQPYSPAAGTGLSSHELNMPGAYKDVSDTTVVAQFRLEKNEASQSFYDLSDTDDVFVIAWTTTPWTLPSNTALAVGKAIDYVLVRTFNTYTKEPMTVILAEALVSKWFKPEGADASIEDYDGSQKIIPYRILKSFKGESLLDLRYEQLLPFAQVEEGDSFKIIHGDFVSTGDGTGIVHIAPSFGSDDMMVGKANGMGALTLVDKQGKFGDNVGPFSGRYVKDYKDEADYKPVDIDIAIYLKEQNRAFNVQKYVHSYPHCWRTDKPVLYYPLDSWFIRTTAKKDTLIALNKTINWQPSHTGEKRFGNWLENLQDWNLSRSRYWGTPLPIWRNESGTTEICIGSIQELQTEIDKANQVLGLSQVVPQDLHRPYIDDIVLVDENGEKMHRESDLIDVWFDSGAMPYAQWHYPFENEEKFKESYPADFISEGVDQTRGWFFTLHAIAGMLFDSVSFKSVVSTGLVLDKNGKKMSKRLGNTVDPFEAISSQGADAIRWYMMANSQPWDNLKFDMAGVEEVKRKFFGTLYNTYSFFALYANIDGFSYQEADVPLDQRSELDRWILSALNTLTKDVKQAYSDFEPTIACRRIMEFTDGHLSNWYVRLSRRRFWKGEYSTDKISAYQTLYRCLDTIAHLMAPVAPFFADWLFQNLNKTSQKSTLESVHLSLMPAVNEAEVDPVLEERMDYAQRASSLILSLRKREKIRVRQPLEKMLVAVLDADKQKQIAQVEDLILAEVNVKQLDFVDDTSGVISKKIKPNFKTLGRKLGKQMKAANQVIGQLSQEDINRIEKEGGIMLAIEGEEVRFELEDFVISSEDIPGWFVASDGDLTVALDVNISEDLRLEGIARELINRIQNLRKSSDLQVTDRIEVKIQGDENTQAAIEKFGDYIGQEVLADSVVQEETVTGSEVAWLDGDNITVALNRS